jgi:hypothetical protein
MSNLEIGFSVFAAFWVGSFVFLIWQFRRESRGKS